VSACVLGRNEIVMGQPNIVSGSVEPTVIVLRPLSWLGGKPRRSKVPRCTAEPDAATALNASPEPLAPGTMSSSGPLHRSRSRAEPPGLRDCLPLLLNPYVGDNVGAHSGYIEPRRG
jgi:hypothetical protein